MNQIEKKLRFINFIVKSIKYNSTTIFNNLKNLKFKRYPIILKFKIRDIKSAFFVIIEKDSINISSELKIKRKVNCFITINRAKTLHNLLKGRILPTAISLIGKVSINADNKKYIPIFYTIITSTKKSYNEIIKGTRFTLVEK
ncbi:MAG TPA: hypothetical protein PLE45_08190 [Spirochaetota bacterium]|nr:hypothetical protein [Spirochaetota bacterium]HOL57116.1 hypothetical protein [Spirochaetota bacterium]HPP04720.1 hypothetical protein [Spirochaetota bacterium]